MTVRLMRREGVEYNTDPQRRCYNGCHFSSEWVFGEWREWGQYPTEADAKTQVRLFGREGVEWKTEKVNE